MKNSLDSKIIYRVFSIIQEKGEKKDDGWHYHGLIADSDQDGYNISIHDPYVKLSLGFHHSYHLDYKSGLEAEDFTNKLLDIYRSKPE
ncbi:DUF3081 domain-containing protein [Catenovulum sp. 2E275]|uniref:DUF3081 domain-containing protein n=1 Tax=Catenovulum sp. 2E275 TaxID=2980497 RepID=UPI0021CE2FC6|nr:DUF3081 domain-containing protein [Catenovulum sp. 2E275]MCU4675347.1 DUF3081 domain-containing protein [Catenovulum sp. 2E275]